MTKTSERRTRKLDMKSDTITKHSTGKKDSQSRTDKMHSSWLGSRGSDSRKKLAEASTF